MLHPVIVSIAAERKAFRVLNPLVWNPLIAFSSQRHVTFTDVHAGSLHFDLDNNLPQFALHQIKAATLKSNVASAGQRGEDGNFHRCISADPRAAAGQGEWAVTEGKYLHRQDIDQAS